MEEGKPKGFHVDCFGRSLDHGYEVNTKTATIRSETENWRLFGPESYSLVLGAASETTPFHLVIEKQRCLLLGSIDAPHTAGSLVGARRRGGLQQRGIFSFWTPSRDDTLDPVTPPDVAP